jgi:hypothetical protein
MVKMYGPHPRWRANYIAKRAQKNKLARLGPDATSMTCIIGTTTSNNNSQVKVQPNYRQKYNAKRKANRADARKIVETETQIATRLALNKRISDKYNALTLHQRRRNRGRDREMKRRIQRKFITAQRAVAWYKLVIDQLETDENKAYMNNQSLRKLLRTPAGDMIQYLVGSQCNLDPKLVEEMDPIIRLATFMQCDRVNEIFTDTQRRTTGKRENTMDRSANIINHFQTVANSFDDGAIRTALRTFWTKSLRDDSGACSKVALTVAINQQAYMSCNMTGLQTVADCVNRDLPSSAGIMPGRTTIQHCGHEIATGTKEVVSATVDDDHRVYRVDFVSELLNIVHLPHVQQDLQLPVEKIRMCIDDSYVGDPAWK